ncbi:putative sporulation protein (polysaccharide deacetylase family) [Caldicoprobacter guelmensis]|uniref:polysaccharide deacetylase family protein n=1 Tax=Caldicoprobacter guelmensis TaxID=1170224 RepID=UPI001956D9B1|nr:polysaccharide deacetylase family protein [Caldicoprobacter guelmensis]MBM7581433.1 putative sporulation protein (polysaccharide deacetylase family) [Caldicoprobacter guelmensis]
MIIILRKRTLVLGFAVVALIGFILYSGHGEAHHVFNYLSTGNPIYKGDDSQPRIAFECNVVWGTEYIPAMLDILKQHNVKITFFIGGQWAEQNPELLKRMVQEGHELGNHGYSHKYHSRLNLEQNKDEIIKAEEAIERVVGVKTRLFAPPYGDFNKTTLQAAHSLGYKTIMWSIDTIDWRGDGVDSIIRRVFKNPHNGAFILMHPTEDTIKALPVIINGLQQRGYEIVRVSDLLKE